MDIERDDSPGTPKDAREVTDEQLVQEYQQEHQDADPDAPGGQLTRDQVADET